MRFYLALWFAKLLNFIIRIVDKNKGTNFSGEKALRLDPHLVRGFKGIDFDKVLFITGTNGKSSTTNLLHHIMKDKNRNVVCNLEGANLLPGIATALSKASDLAGNIKADYLIFETDERYLPIIYKELPARNLLITNLQKDQVQRNGDPDFIMRKFRTFINKDMTLYLNNSDPRSKALEDLAGRCLYFDADRHPEAYEKGRSFPTQGCEKCGSRIDFEYLNIENIGRFRCSGCGFTNEAKPQIMVEDIDFGNRTFTVDGRQFNMPYNLPYMLYNYGGALLAATEFAGIPLDDTVASFSTFQNIMGRYEEIPFKNKTIRYMRIKQENPDTLQNALNVVARDKNPKALCIGLYLVSDFIPHYTNTFYTYDCDFKDAVASGIDEYLCFSETVAHDTALRLIYEGVPKDRIKIQNSEDIRELFENIDAMKNDTVYLITWLASYDALKKIIKEMK